MRKALKSPASNAGFWQIDQACGHIRCWLCGKAVNNMLLAVNLCAAAEGFTTLKAHGVDLNEALDCINASSGKSNVTETVLPQRVLNRSFPVTFALPLLAKDTGIALDLARDAKLAVPLLALGQSLVQAASNLSDKNSDFSSAVKCMNHGVILLLSNISPLNNNKQT